MLGEMGEVEDWWLPRMPSLNTEVPNSPRHTYLCPSPFMLVAAPSLRDLPLLLSQPPCTALPRALTSSPTPWWCP